MILFKPFFENLPCKEIKIHGAGNPPPAYLRDTVSDKNWLTIWLPKSPEEIKAIKNYDTKSYSLGEVVMLFPKTLGAELVWMLPLSLGLTLLLLIGYYRRLAPSLVSLLPFLSGVGMYFACVVVFGWSFSFISIISLIMIFGFSIDYGIFAANLYILKDPPEPRGVWTCLLFAGLVTLLGFLPLALCRHPVLIHLGQTLVAGTAGTLIGTLWGIPGVFQLGWIQGVKK
jgi:predicted RND superfamily exporter protein